jgi:rhodanese-related sulfurtransferase
VGARSARAAREAKKLGYDKAQSIVGGLQEWQKQNLPLEKGAA